MKASSKLKLQKKVQSSSANKQNQKITIVDLSTKVMYWEEKNIESNVCLKDQYWRFSGACQQKKAQNNNKKKTKIN